MDRSNIKKIVLFFLAIFLFAVVSPTFAQTPEKNSYAGIFYGYVHDVRPDFSAVTVKPIEKSERRHRFYLDKATEVYVEKKRKKRNALYLGDKVAVRYFAKGKTVVADAIYVVFGEFVPKDYLKKKKLAVIKKEGSEKGKEGHGAEAKKDAKPKSGEHH